MSPDPLTLDPVSCPDRRTTFLPAISGALLIAALSAPSAAAPGYTPRNCGLDMNRNGIVGEPGDCNVCDGTTLDPDGDGVREDLFYIDAGTGSDSSTCGAPSSPCKTITYAWNRRADGPGDGAEDILCVRGTFREERLGPARGGVPGTYQVRATGEEFRDWNFPRNPTMLVGWDRDNDGKYPPLDGDDVAILDGAGRSRAFVLGSSHVEIAHLEIRDYGKNANGDSGVWKWAGDDQISHHWYHDLAISGINQGSGGGSSTSVANLFSNDTHLSWIAWTNLQFLDIDDWGWRGSGGLEEDEGPFRLQGLTYRMKGCNYSTCGDAATLTFWKSWAHLSQVEILDNVIDGNTGAWQPKPSGGPHGTLFVALTPCSQKFVIRNNLLRNIKVGLMLQPGFSNIGCVRPIDDVRFERNVSENTFEWGFGSSALLHVADVTRDARATVKNVALRGNVVRVKNGGRYERAISSFHAAPNQPGSLLLENNEMFGVLTCIVNAKLGVGTWTVRGNYCEAERKVLDLDERPKSWSASGNTYWGAEMGNGPTQGWSLATGGEDPPDEGPSPTATLRFAQSSVAGNEGTTASLSVVREGDDTGSVSVAWRTIAGTAQGGSDFRAASGTLLWQAGQSGSKTIAVDLLADSVQEPNETLQVELRTPSGAEIGSPSRATVTVRDVAPSAPEPPPSGGAGSIAFADARCGGLEGSSVPIVVQRSGGSSGAASVHWRTAPGSAKAETDYVGAAGTLTWGDGDASPRTVVVSLVADSLVEGLENFQVRLSDVTGATLGEPDSHRVDVIDVTQTTDAPEPEPEPGRTGFTVSHAQASEGKSVALTLVRAGGTSGVVSVRVTTRAGTAKAGSDFVPMDLEVTWGNGDDTSRTVVVSTLQDTADEPDESFTVELSEPAGGLGFRPHKTVAVTIADDDGVSTTSAGSVSLRSTEFHVGEGDGWADILLERTEGSRGSVSVAVSTTAGSAQASADFVPAGAQRVTWGAGEHGQRKLRIELLDDPEVEGPESFEVRLHTPAGGVQVHDPSTALVTVYDDDIDGEPAVPLAAAAAGPSIALSPDGGRALVWQQGPEEDSSAWLLLFDAEGAPTGPAQRIGKRGAASPVAVFDRFGKLAVAWHEPAAASFDRRVLATTFSSAGPGKILVLGDDQPLPTRLALAADGAGRFLASWTTDAGELAARRFDSEAQTSELLVHAASPAARATTTLAGDLVTVIEARDGLAIRMLDPAGNTRVPLRRVVTSASARNPAIAASPTGDMVLAWDADGDEGRDVYAVRLDALANTLDAPFRVNTLAPGDQTRPVVAINGVGDFAVAWADDPAGGGLRTRFFASDGTPAGGDLAVAVPDGEGTPDDPALALADTDDVLVAFSRKDAGGVASGSFLRTFSPALGASTCRESERTLCLDGGRFRVGASWRAPDGNSGAGQARAVTGETGYFWFFDGGNIEILVKALDACQVNERLWVFAGGLTDVETVLTVEDTSTGESRTYYNPVRTSFAPVRDTDAFRSCPAPDRASAGAEVEWELEAPELATIAEEADAGDACEGALCLAGGRYRIEASWQDGSGASGVAEGAPLTAESGYFWFFGPDNVELVVKVLPQACQLNGHVWVFAGGLTDVGVDLRVTDLLTGGEATYRTEPGTGFVPIMDTTALAASCGAQH